MAEYDIKQLLEESRFDFVDADDKAFIVAFDAAMLERGYGLETNGHYKGYVWGRFMLIYRKLSVKAKKVPARIYLRDNEIALRLYFSNIDKHRTYIESLPPHIKGVFTGTHGSCAHCGEESCKHRKTYTIDGRVYEKCDGVTFEFGQPDLEKLPEYLALLDEFYPVKKLKS
ncbi:MAG: hypothetical protein FWD06_10010 [Oscillospiraceae bacterium]|nr:hypothetical protein [Oscillospiraceae bacterium]